MTVKKFWQWEEKTSFARELLFSMSSVWLINIQRQLQEKEKNKTKNNILVRGSGLALAWRMYCGFTYCPLPPGITAQLLYFHGHCPPCERISTKQLLLPLAGIRG